MVPDISPSTDLTQGQSLNIAVNFQPAGGSGLRKAILLITLNDTDNPIYSVALSGLGSIPNCCTCRSSLRFPNRFVENRYKPALYDCLDE